LQEHGQIWGHLWGNHLLKDQKKARKTMISCSRSNSAEENNALLKDNNALLKKNNALLKENNALHRFLMTKNGYMLKKPLPKF